MATGTIKVKAGANGPVILPQPIDGLRAITDTVEVPNTRFIRGRIAAGDLVLVPAASPAPTARAAKKED